MMINENLKVNLNKYFVHRYLFIYFQELFKLITPREIKMLRHISIMTHLQRYLTFYDSNWS